MPRIDFSTETARRVRLHCAVHPGQSVTGLVNDAVRTYLEKHATDAERAGWTEDEGLDTFGQQILAAAEDWRERHEPFFLAEVMAKAGFPTYGQAQARAAGNALRAGGYTERRGRLRGGPPTKVWDPPKQ